MTDGVKIMWTAQGMLMADITNDHGDVYELENPVYVNITQQGAQLFPFVSLVTDETTIEMRKTDLMFNAFTAEPFPQLRDAYREMFGKIQLLSK